MKVHVVSSRESLRNAMENADIVIWDGRASFFEVLSDLKEVPNQAKLRTRLARNVIFSAPVIAFNENAKIQGRSLADLMKAIFESERMLFKSDLSDCTLVVTSNSQDEVIMIMQQMANMRFVPQVVTLEEMRIRRRLENFRTHSGTLVKTSQNTRTAIERIPCKLAKTRQMKEEIIKNLEKIEALVEEFSRKKVRVAVFATKKSGKSMVVNCLLGEEYAPTSLELPTPTVIEYIPSHDTRIRLEKHDQILSFEKAQDIKDYLYEEFSNVSKSGKKLPRFRVHYPKKGKEYVIYDTPGPDLANSEHGEFIGDIIAEADAAVFVIDYEKHTQVSEIELLEQVLQKFIKRKGTLVAAINKIDLMFQDEALEKMLTRATEFIREKLEVLKAKKVISDSSILLVPVSAIWQFYISKLEEEFPELKTNLRLVDEIETERTEGLEAYLTTISRTSSILRWIYGVKQPTSNDVKFLSNFETFERYLDYLVTKKTVLHDFSDVFNEIGSLLSVIQGISTSMAAATLQKEIIERAIQRYMQDSKKRLEQLEKELEMIFRSAQTDTKTLLKDFFKKFFKNLRDSIDSIPQEIYKDLQVWINPVVSVDNVEDYRNNIRKLNWQIVEILSGLIKHWFALSLNKDEIFDNFEKELQKRLNELGILISKSVERASEDLQRYSKDFLKALEKDVPLNVEPHVPVIEVFVSAQELKEEISNMALDLIQDLYSYEFENVKTELEKELEQFFLIKWFKEIFGVIDEKRKKAAEVLYENYVQQIQKFVLRLVTTGGPMDNVMKTSQTKGEEFLDKTLENVRSKTTNSLRHFLDGVWKLEEKIKDIYQMEVLEKAEFAEFSKRLNDVLYTGPQSLQSLWDQISNVSDKRGVLET